MSGDVPAYVTTALYELHREKRSAIVAECRYAAACHAGSEADAERLGLQRDRASTALRAAWSQFDECLLRWVRE